MPINSRSTLAGAQPAVQIDGALLGDAAVAVLKRVGDARCAASRRVGGADGSATR